LQFCSNSGFVTTSGVIMLFCPLLDDWIACSISMVRHETWSYSTWFGKCSNRYVHSVSILWCSQVWLYCSYSGTYQHWWLVVKLAWRAAKFHLWLQARRQGLAAGLPKNRWRGNKTEGGQHFKNTVLDVCSNQGAKREMGGHRFQMGGACTTGPPQATALSGGTYGIVALAVFIISGVYSHSSSPNLIKPVIFSCPYWYIASV